MYMMEEFLQELSTNELEEQMKDEPKPNKFLYSIQIKSECYGSCIKIDTTDEWMLSAFDTREDAIYNEIKDYKVMIIELVPNTDLSNLPYGLEALRIEGLHEESDILGNLPMSLKYLDLRRVFQFSPDINNLPGSITELYINKYIDLESLQNLPSSVTHLSMTDFSHHLMEDLDLRKLPPSIKCVEFVKTFVIKSKIPRLILLPDTVEIVYMPPPVHLGENIRGREDLKFICKMRPTFFNEVHNFLENREHPCLRNLPVTKQVNEMFINYTQKEKMTS